MKNQTLGKTIALLRKSKGYTQMELAERIGVSDKAISRWERDETSPDISALISLADEFGVTIDDLIKGNVKVTNTAGAGETEAEKSAEKGTDDIDMQTVTTPDVSACQRVLDDKIEKYKRTSFTLYVILLITFVISMPLVVTSVPATVVYLILFIMQLSALYSARLPKGNNIDHHLKSDYFVAVFKRGKNFILVMLCLQVFQSGISLGIVGSIFNQNVNYFPIIIMFTIATFIILSAISMIVFKIIVKVKKLYINQCNFLVNQTNIVFLTILVIISFVLIGLYTYESKNVDKIYSEGDKFYSLEAFKEAKTENKYNSNAYMKVLSEDGDVLWENSLSWKDGYDKMKEQFAKAAPVYAFTADEAERVKELEQACSDKYVTAFDICAAVLLVANAVTVFGIKKKNKI